MLLLGKTSDIMEQSIIFMSGLTKWLADFLNSMSDMLPCSERVFQVMILQLKSNYGWSVTYALTELTVQIQP